MTTELSTDKRSARLLHKRRVWQGAWLFVPGAALVLFPSFIGSLLRLEPWSIAAAGVLALLMGIFWSASGTKCPGCNLNLLWHGMTHAKNADWFTWVVNASACPRCGYPESDHSERRAGKAQSD
jgi:hypothetical protein